MHAVLLRQAARHLPRDYYVDQLLGSDSNSGKSPGAGQAFQTTAPLAGKRLFRGVGFAKGGTYGRFTPANGGASARPLIFDAYGSGAAPIFKDATPFSSGSWVNVSGDEWKVATASTFNGSGIWWDSGNGAGVEGQVAYLAKGTSGSLSANQYVITGGELHVNIGREPVATDVFELPPTSSASLIGLDGKSHVVLRGLGLRYANGDLLSIATSAPTDNILVQYCDLGYCLGGLLHAGTGGVATNIIADTCVFHDQYGAQNAVSLHCDVGPGSMATLNCTFRRIAGWGTTSHDNATFLRYKCLYDGAYNLCIGGGAGGGTGLHDFIGCRWVNEPPEKADSTYHWQGVEGAFAPAVGTVIRLYNNSFARGTGSHAIRVIVRGGGTWTVRNLAVWGAYGFGLNGSATNGTLDSDYVAIGGTGFDRFLWAAGAHDLALAGDPYTNVGANNLSPKVASVLLGAGVAITGVTTGTPPDIGYTGAL